MFLMKHFSTWSIFHWLLKKCLSPISIATVFMETTSFIRIMQPISPNYPWENGVKQIKRAEQKLSQSCIFWSIIKDKDFSSRVKMHQKKFSLNFYLHLSYTCWVDVVYLTCLTFLKSLWKPDETFCAQTILTWKLRLLKENIRKYFVAHQKFSKIFHDQLIYT